MAHTVVPPPPRATLRVKFAQITPLVRAEGTRTVVVLRGEADFSTRPVLAAVLSRMIALGTGDVVIDLAETEFIDSAIVRALAEGQQLLGRRGRKLTFRSPSRLATRLLDLFGLSDLIEARDGVQP